MKQIEVRFQAAMNTKLPVVDPLAATPQTAMKEYSSSAWAEYASAADYLAARGLKGKEGDPLPDNLSPECLELINSDIEAFQSEVKLAAYARAMLSVGMKP